MGTSPLRFLPHSSFTAALRERCYYLHLADQEMRPKEDLPEHGQHVAELQGCHSHHGLCVWCSPGSLYISDSQTLMFGSPGDLLKTDFDSFTLKCGPRFCISNKFPGDKAAAWSLDLTLNSHGVQPAQLRMAALPNM